MSIAEIIPAVRALSRCEKLQLAQMLVEDLAREELPALFKKGQVYPIYTPVYAPHAAAQLAQLLIGTQGQACISVPVVVAEFHLKNIGIQEPRKPSPASAMARAFQAR